jgi:hypothetical protein
MVGGLASDFGHFGREIDYCWGVAGWHVVVKEKTSGEVLQLFIIKVPRL